MEAYLKQALDHLAEARSRSNDFGLMNRINQSNDSVSLYLLTLKHYKEKVSESTDNVVLDTNT